MKKRILFLADPNSIHDLKWMQAFTVEYDVYLILRKQHFKKINFTKEDFFKLHNMRIISQIEDFSIVWFWKDFFLAFQLKIIIVKYKIEIFHVLYAEPNALLGNFKGLLEIPLILTTRGTDVLKTIPNTFIRKDLLNRVVSTLYKRALKKFDVITCTSLSQIEILKYYNLTSSEPVLIRTGIDTFKIDEVIKNGCLENKLVGGQYILFSRNMRALYNHELALEAISLLPKELISRYKMVFIDADSVDTDYTNKIRNMMKEIPASFVFLDTQSQEAIWNLNKGASLVVMTPKSDGSPVSAIEALYCGTRVILPPLQYDSDLFGENVIHFTDWKAENLARTIAKALELKSGLNDKVKAIIKENADRMNEMAKLNVIYKMLLLR